MLSFQKNAGQCATTSFHPEAMNWLGGGGLGVFFGGWGQGRCERRSEVFVKFQKKNFQKKKYFF